MALQIFEEIEIARIQRRLAQGSIVNSEANLKTNRRSFVRGRMSSGEYELCKRAHVRYLKLCKAQINQQSAKIARLQQMNKES